MFSIAKYGQENDDEEEQALDDIMQGELPLDARELGFSFWRKTLTPGRLKQRNTFPGEHPAVRRPVDDGNDEENNLRNEPSFTVPMEFGTEIPVVDIADPGEEKKHARDGGEECKRTGRASDGELQPDFFFARKPPLEKPPAKHGRKQQADGKEVDEEIVGTIHTIVVPER